MADSLSPEEAKAALAGVVHGKARKILKPTTEDAKETLRRMARAPTLLSLARTEPLIALSVALGYGFILGSSRADRTNFAGFLTRILSKS